MPATKVANGYKIYPGLYRDMFRAAADAMDKLYENKGSMIVTGVDELLLSAVTLGARLDGEYPFWLEELLSVTDPESDLYKKYKNAYDELMAEYEKE